MSRTDDQSIPVARPAAFARSQSWVIRRAAFGLTLLLGLALGGAVLLDASIDASADGLQAQSE